MLVDELQRAFAAQQQRERVEPGDGALQLDAFDEEDGDGQLGSPDTVQELVLQAQRPNSHNAPRLLLLALPFFADAESLELTVQRGAFHPDERCGARDVA